LPGHAGGQAVGGMLADDRSGLAAGAGGQKSLFQQDHPADPPFGQGQGDTRADHAAADEQDVTDLDHAKAPAVRRWEYRLRLVSILINHQRSEEREGGIALPSHLHTILSYSKGERAPNS